MALTNVTNLANLTLFAALVVILTLIMIKAAEQVAYPLTGYFSKLVSDYLEANQKLTPFYTHTPDINGVKAAMAARDSFNTPRGALVDALNKQYEIVNALESVMDDNKEIILLTQKKSSVEDPGQKDLYKTGTIGNILQLLNEDNVC